jgi:hypothetical protein
MSLDATDLAACLRYRRAYGEAARLLEASRFNHASGRAFASRVDGERGAILRAVLHQLGHDRRDLVELAGR